MNRHRGLLGQVVEPDALARDEAVQPHFDVGMLREEREVELDGTRMDHVVTVDEPDVVAPGAREAVLASGIDAAVGDAVNEEASAEPPRPGVKGGGGGVRRAVVDGDDFPAVSPVGLHRERLKTGVEPPFEVVDGNDDGKGHRIGTSSSRTSSRPLNS